MISPADHFNAREWADVYDSPDDAGSNLVFRAGREIAREQCLRLSSPGQIWIEAGCGTGHLGADLAAAQLRVIGFDHDPQMARTARQRFGLACAAAKAERFPFADKCADGLIATAVAGCLPDLVPFLQEILRILKNNGCAIITSTNRVSSLHGINRLIYRPQGCYRAYSLAEAGDLLRRTGFTTESFQFYNFFVNTERWNFPSARISRRLETSLPSFLRSRLGRNLVIVARKQS
jgi:ubiquinone/menaquinone biosynthesis C-methylase UbiE